MMTPRPILTIRRLIRMIRTRMSLILILPGLVDILFLTEVGLLTRLPFGSCGCRARGLRVHRLQVHGLRDDDLAG
jgi:hypothetical protein